MNGRFRIVAWPDICCVQDDAGMTSDQHPQVGDSDPAGNLIRYVTAWLAGRGFVIRTPWRTTELTGSESGLPRPRPTLSGSSLRSGSRDGRLARDEGQQASAWSSSRRVIELRVDSGMAAVNCSLSAARP